eukprot:39172-Eustigmatos_ZCMA.PRE.1
MVVSVPVTASPVQPVHAPSSAVHAARALQCRAASHGTDARHSPRTPAPSPTDEDDLLFGGDSTVAQCESDLEEIDDGDDDDFLKDLK